MVEWMYPVTLLLVWACGYVTGRNVSRRPRSRPPDQKESREIIVKRTKPSFRDPSKTTVTSYERYKTRDGLFAPVKPGKGPQADERDIRK